jgi:predicted TIM-barrel enzyme
LTVNPDAIVLVHGGPVAMPDDADFVLKNTRKLSRLLRRLLNGAAADRGRAVEQTSAFKAIRGS